jgi:LytR cell envelope-related transcriptional attenuator
VNIHVKTLLTLTVLSVLMVVGVAWGYTALTTPFPHTTSTPPCTSVTYQAGQRIAPPQVLVSVYNASSRIGLAESTIAAFENQGFGPGTVGNAPHGAVVHYAQVWTDDPTRPDVKLVISRLGPRARVFKHSTTTQGVTVVVGPKFTHLVKGRPSVKITTATAVCSPPT